MAWVLFYLMVETRFSRSNNLSSQSAFEQNDRWYRVVLVDADFAI
jgi:hypothetical protein